ncbi:ABC transporter ATP-binding protein [Lapillicoccus jejuensis]|uniref:ABC-2 type transport system ATP-binding protein n=1 Tax=Lapillicoccus jejuensis TaxID=402171 RepID=A0A542DYN8_9MICO|nr:ATP-binding cassette domain-containing protein [Lapillicoccus jejuensis]TQJ08197.1 ABC-2 type transport system ATP-binding protein [Lapillicoccus jejuensis]
MLETRGLTRTFGDVTAVDGVDLSVPAGTLTGFVGGNGAGKTTTMRMVMGILRPTAGEVLWQGRPATPADRARFGYMPEERGLYPKQPLLRQLVYLGRLHGLTAAAATAAATEHLERFGLADRAGDKLESLSLGNQQRVQIAAALLATPSALVLDEPFSGLDPEAVDAMADLLREHAARGVPVLFSSHQLDLVERLCDSLVVLSRGRVVAAGTTDELRHRGRVRHRLVVDGDAGWVRDVDGVSVLDVDGGTAVLELLAHDAADRVLREALARGSVRELSPLVPSLSEIYREVTA